MVTKKSVRKIILDLNDFEFYHDLEPMMMKVRDQTVMPVMMNVVPHQHE
jgi:hypothetical protein